MEILVGIDIGSDTIKAALIIDGKITRFEPAKISGKPIDRLLEVIKNIQETGGISDNEVLFGLTGSSAGKVAEILGLNPVPEPEALSAAFNYYSPGTRNIIEIGAETQKYLTLSTLPSPSSSLRPPGEEIRDENGPSHQGRREKRENVPTTWKEEENKEEVEARVGDAVTSNNLFLSDIILGGKCAGGTGFFLDYMHKRLNFNSFEDFVQTGLSVESPAGISGRCAVFAESDVVHHYQKGMPKERIVAGIHKAVARNYKSLIRKGEVPQGKVAFIGGVSQNPCLEKYLTAELELSLDQLFVPELSLTMGALGAALKAEERFHLSRVRDTLERQTRIPFEYENTNPITLKKSIILEEPSRSDIQGKVGLASLGVDIGSVSTKAVVIARIGNQFCVLGSHYRRTEGNPVEAVKKALEVIYQEIKEKGIILEKTVAATTGSGRYLTGYFVGANHIINEITAQAWGVNVYIKDKDLTIFEIGGQDSKFIRMREGRVTDFEMNWACAAGTGALIEKHAKNLDIPIEEFGDYALKGTKPPIINGTCAVFAESALLYFQQNNVSIEDLSAGACLASVSNYLVKVVRNRSLGEKVAFQGAVAFNKGMVGAFETLLNRPILVPPYPHLTGAIGAARIALEEAEEKESISKFRGFEEIIGATYNLSSFQCKRCGNECQVNKFEAGKEFFFQGDRCDHYSGTQKGRSKGENLSDLFKWREELTLNIYSEYKKKGNGSPLKPKRVGIPQGLLFNDYYPFFQAFFEELGLEVVPSRRTNKEIISLGIEKTISEPCFPVKVAHGHAASLLEETLDFLFLPMISGEKPMGNYKTCITCPYIHAAPDMLRHALGIDNLNIKLLSPTFHFNWGYKHLLSVLSELGKELNKNPRDIKRALDQALLVLEDFRERIKKKGEEVLGGLIEGKGAGEERVFVIIGKPYAVYDPLLNMDIGKKIRDEGYFAVPLDFLPLEEEDLSDSFENLYPAQGQKELSAARYISRNKNLHAVVITYFGCGSDAFLDQFFKEELNQAYLTIQIDEHTSDTGVLTRIQAYLASISSKEAKKEKLEIKTQAKMLTEIKGRRLWVPYMSEVSTILAAVMRARGIDAQVLKRSPDPALSLAREVIHGDVCIPMLYSTEDMLYRATSKDFDPEKEAFFQGKAEGPCRYGMYYMLQKILLNRIHKNVDIVSINNANVSKGLGMGTLLLTFDALLAHDQLEKMLHHTRPYELNKGDTERVFHKYIGILCKEVLKPEYRWNSGIDYVKIASGRHLEGMEELLHAASREFERIPKHNKSLSHIGLVGEFFVRCHFPSNQDIIRKVEALGGEVWLAPASEFLIYANYISEYFAGKAWKHLGKYDSLLRKVNRHILNHLATREEHHLFSATLPYMRGFEEIPAKTLVEYGSIYMSKDFGGEAICSLGKSEDFACRGLDGVVSVIPFNCMPGLIVAAISREIRRNHQNLPFLTVDYDGFTDAIKDQQLVIFMSQVKERLKLRNRL